MELNKICLWKFHLILRFLNSYTKFTIFIHYILGETVNSRIVVQETEKCPFEQIKVIIVTAKCQMTPIRSIESKAYYWYYKVTLVWGCTGESIALCHSLALDGKICFYTCVWEIAIGCNWSYSPQPSTMLKAFPVHITINLCFNASVFVRIQYFFTIDSTFYQKI